MKKIVLVLICTGGILLHAGTQVPAAPKPIRITDSLTDKEKGERNPILLQSELDSLIKRYAPPQLPAEQPLVPGKESSFPESLLLTGMGVLVVLSLLILYMSWQQRRWFRKLPAPAVVTPAQPRNDREAVPARKKSGAPVDQDRQQHPDKDPLPHKQEEAAQGSAKSKRLEADYDTLCQAIRKTYKIRHYPGYDPEAQLPAAVIRVLETEKAIADNAFEQFLKPLLALADKNKNHPGKMSEQDKDSLNGLLISLSFLYIEYLYLRVGDLALGASIIERLGAFTAGTGLQEDQLKKLNMDAGSRALVMRLALDKTTVTRLPYPVFDETNLNKS